MNLKCCNPCLSRTPPEFIKYLAAVDVVITVLSMILICGGEFIIINSGEESKRLTALMSILIAMVVSILKTLLAAKLIISVRDKFYSGCRRWLFMTFVLIPINLFLYGYFILMAGLKSGLVVAGAVLGMWYNPFEPLYVLQFMRELMTKTNAMNMDRIA